ncbi:hypothetical protein OUZ56_030229 [Daphnia magna]|uniref:Uncharacterized protein n=1 Tax=Daphnia magna TaxID=35525 RepID=A0ABQ9ZQP4_9CRUS|nr:hypothetical protein OUZ56_030229 [Daphnia magna]
MNLELNRIQEKVARAVSLFKIYIHGSFNCNSDCDTDRDSDRDCDQDSDSESHQDFNSDSHQDSDSDSDRDVSEPDPITIRIHLYSTLYAESEYELKNNHFSVYAHHKDYADAHGNVRNKVLFPEYSPNVKDGSTSSLINAHNDSNHQAADHRMTHIQ